MAFGFLILGFGVLGFQGLGFGVPTATSLHKDALGMKQVIARGLGIRVWGLFVVFFRRFSGSRVFGSRLQELGFRGFRYGYPVTRHTYI